MIFADGKKRGRLMWFDIVDVSCTPLKIPCKPDSKSTSVANQAMSCKEVDGNFDDESKLKGCSSAWWDWLENVIVRKKRKEICPSNTT